MSRSERTFRAHALILKRRDFGEADRLLTVLTAERGKFNVIAKGARKPTSAKTGHVELFTITDMLVHKGRDIDIATQAETVEPFLEVREDLNRGAYASYCAELLDRFTQEGDDDIGPLYNLMKDTLNRLCVDDDHRLVARYFELQLLDIVGFRPELNECVLTRDPIQPEDQFFSVANGGVVSPQAAQHSATLMPLSLGALKFLRYVQRSPYSRVVQLEISPQLHTEVERIMLAYITFLLERRLQSVDFIRRIRMQAQ